VFLTIGAKAAHLRELGMSDRAIARGLGISDKTVAKAISATSSCDDQHAALSQLVRRASGSFWRRGRANNASPVNDRRSLGKAIRSAQPPSRVSRIDQAGGVAGGVQMKGGSGSEHRVRRR
jgi:hypothetical protein